MNTQTAARPMMVSVQISAEEYQSWPGPRSTTSWTHATAMIKAEKPRPSKRRGWARPSELMNSHANASVRIPSGTLM